MITNWRIQSDNFIEKSFKNMDGFLLDLGAGNDSYGQKTGNLNRVSVDTGEHGEVDVIADITKTLPFEDESYEAILLSNVLEHIAYPLPLLKECNRVLKTGGKMVITVPFMIKLHQEPIDFNRYTKYMLVKLLEDSGFKQYTITELGCSSNIAKTIIKKLYHPIISKIIDLLPTRNSDRFPMGYGIEVFK